MKLLLTAASYTNNGTHDALSLHQISQFVRVGTDSTRNMVENQYILGRFRASHGCTELPEFKTVDEKSLMPELKAALVKTNHPVAAAFGDIDADIDKDQFDEILGECQWNCNVDEKFKSRMLDAGISARYFGEFLGPDIDL